MHQLLKAKGPLFLFQSTNHFPLFLASCMHSYGEAGQTAEDPNRAGIFMSTITPGKVQDSQASHDIAIHEIRIQYQTSLLELTFKQWGWAKLLPVLGERAYHTATNPYRIQSPGDIFTVGCSLSAILWNRFYNTGILLFTYLQYPRLN